MSFTNFSDTQMPVDISLEDAVNLLLASVAFEEFGLAHLIDAEAEKLQYVLGTLGRFHRLIPPPTFDQLLAADASVDHTLKDIIKKEMLLQFKLDNVLAIPASITTTSSSSSSSSSTSEPDIGSAWSVGTDFGTGNAQYTYIESDQEEKTVDLGLGAAHIPIGSVEMIRSGDDILVTISTNSPYLMDQVHLYVDDEIPTNSAPGLFPYQYTVNNPAGYFSTYTFTINVIAFTGETIYVAAHAHIVA